MTEKPSGKARKHPATGPETSPEAGRLGTDDLGNVTWQWTDDDDLLADDPLGQSARLQALVDPTLQVKDEDEDEPRDRTRDNPRGLKSGYNPYNSGSLGKHSWKKKKDLRELSKWIELRKKVATKKDGE